MREMSLYAQLMLPTVQTRKEPCYEY
jgi:hypothetical protein